MSFRDRKYEEADVIAGCVKNDRYSQEMMYRQHFAAMYQMCLRYTTDQETALEIVNDGFIRVFKKIGQFEFKGSLQGWIRRIVFHAVADYFRKQPTQWREVMFEDHDRPDYVSALDTLYADDLLDLVEKLPKATRHVFNLYALEGCSHNDIAEQLGISVGTSKWHLSNARSMLKIMLEKLNYSRSG